MSNLINNLKLVNKMPFYPSSSYLKYADPVFRVMTVLEGSDSVKAEGDTFLPELSGQTSNEYKAYKSRAVFFNLTARVLSTNSGVIVRRTPTLDYNDEMAPYFDRKNMSMLTFNELFRYNVRQCVSLGRVGTLVDVVDDRPMPYKFSTDKIYNWKVGKSGKLEKVLLVYEVVDVDEKTFEETSSIEYMLLDLKVIDGKTIYHVTKFDADGKSTSSVAPSIHGRTLDFIPFVCTTAFGLDIEAIKPTLLEITDLNLSHYRSSADLEHGRHFVGVPQPVVTGATSEKAMRVGSEKAWVIPSKDAKAYYMEFIGKGLTTLSDALKEKQSQISQFSAQLMDTSTRGSEAEGTVRMRYSSDSANLSDIALSVEAGLNAVYKIMAEWLQTSVPSIELNKDFISTKMSYQELTALTKALMDKAITEEIFMYNLERGEMLPPKE